MNKDKDERGGGKNNFGHRPLIYQVICDNVAKEKRAKMRIREEILRNKLNNAFHEIGHPVGNDD